jgi:hypothetical protein
MQIAVYLASGKRVFHAWLPQKGSGFENCGWFPSDSQATQLSSAWNPDG